MARTPKRRAIEAVDESSTAPLGFVSLQDVLSETILKTA
jgi:hypothetical protein